MLTENGNKKLQDFTNISFQEAYLEVTPGICHVSGLGHSNAVFVEGDSQISAENTCPGVQMEDTIIFPVQRS